MKGKLIVIEGTDSSGKETQTKRVVERLTAEGFNILKVEYPNYKSQSSALVKMYLNGEFGDKASDINPYSASAFYAVDRYASYKKEWAEFYNDGGIIIADRYTTSNMIHQASKISDNNEKKIYLDWLYDFEFTKMGLPVPDMVVFLNMPPEMSIKLMEMRKNKISGETEKDIHEKDSEYLRNSYMNACFIAENYKWEKVDCSVDGNLRTIEEIGEEVYIKIKKILQDK